MLMRFRVAALLVLLFAGSLAVLPSAQAGTYDPREYDYFGWGRVGIAWVGSCAPRIVGVDACYGAIGGIPCYPDVPTRITVTDDITEGPADFWVVDEHGTQWLGTGSRELWCDEVDVYIDMCCYWTSFERYPIKGTIRFEPAW